MEKWLRTHGTSELFVLEIGAGLSIPTVRMTCEREWKTSGGFFLRVNPRDHLVRQELIPSPSEPRQPSAPSNKKCPSLIDYERRNTGVHLSHFQKCFRAGEPSITLRLRIWPNSLAYQRPNHANEQNDRQTTAREGLPKLVAPPHVRQEVEKRCRPLPRVFQCHRGAIASTGPFRFDLLHIRNGLSGKFVTLNNENRWAVRINQGNRTML